ncbi:MAG: hypothetical protein HBSAPP03_09580 [Phycisphaerae bacterium]|nr:MAG: hypothetical protein HBSAPP03_09580 [Phycisphaerae bacterium]
MTVVILTLNEEVNIAECLRSCAWCDDVHVVDSGSTDRTVEIARAMGAKVYYNPFESFGKQRNWAIEHCPAAHRWVFHLDADERFTPELVKAMRDLIASDPPEAGYHIPQKFMFMGKWLKRAAVYPTYQMRLFHLDRMRFCDWGHGQRELTQGRVGVLNEPYLHYGLSKGLSEWMDRHNRYSTAEAIEAAKLLREKAAWKDVFSRDPIKRRRAYKEVSYRLPFRAAIRHFVTLFILGAAFEGKPGRTYAQLLNLYERMITLKLRLIRQREKRRSATESPEFERDVLPGVRTTVPPADDGLTGASRVVTLPPRDVPRQPAPTPVATPPAEPEHATATRVEVTTGEGVAQLTPESTPWTFRQKVFRAIWMLVGKPVFRMSFHNWYGFRAWLLRLFGAKIGRDVRLRPSVNIEVPWNLILHDGVTVGDYAILYSLGIIEIGERSIVSQYAHICAGTHDYTDRRFPLIRDPIIIGADAWIGADAFVGPKVKIGRLSVLGARSSAYKDLAPGTVYAGNPARPLKKRELH